MAISEKILLNLMLLAKNITDKQVEVESKTTLTVDDVTAVFDKLVERVKAAHSE